MNMQKLRQAMPWGAITKLAKQFKVSETQIAKILDGKVVSDGKVSCSEVLDATEQLIIEDKKARTENEAKRKRILKTALK